MARLEEERRTWQAAIMQKIEAGNFEAAIRLMAANVGDRGNLQSFVDNYCANVDPLPLRPEVSE